MKVCATWCVYYKNGVLFDGFVTNTGYTMFLQVPRSLVGFKFGFTSSCDRQRNSYVQVFNVVSVRTF